MQDVDGQRLMTKVARLYHTHGLRQTEIAERMRISQSRVSRLLQRAEQVGIVRTVVVVPPSLQTEVEEALQQRYGLSEAYVVDTTGTDELSMVRDLGQALASILGEVGLGADVLGLTSWSRTLREAVFALQPVRPGARRVVEMLGDLGPPELQLEATRATQRLAELVGGQPVLLRTPGVVPSAGTKRALLGQDQFAREAVDLLDDVDLAFVGIGTCDFDPTFQSGGNYFTPEQLKEVARRGAVGQVCLRFIDADGAPVETELDELVVGVTREQLRRVPQRWGVAGGPAKHDAVRAALLGGWVDVLVTDATTARHLLA